MRGQAAQLAQAAYQHGQPQAGAHLAQASQAQTGNQPAAYVLGLVEALLALPPRVVVATTPTATLVAVAGLVAQACGRPAPTGLAGIAGVVQSAVQCGHVRDVAVMGYALGRAAAMCEQWIEAALGRLVPRAHGSG